MRMIYYTEVNAICVIILLLFLSHLRRHSERFSTNRIIFNQLIVTAILLCLSDITACFVSGKSFEGARMIAEISNICYFEGITIISFLWSIYVDVRLTRADAYDKKRLLLISLPLVAFSLLLLSNPFTGLFFTLDELNVYTRGSLVWLHWVVTWSYLLIPTARTVLAVLAEKNKHKRGEITPLLCFIIAPAAASVIQMCCYGVTITQAGITLSIVMLCLSVQSSQVLTDALTGLNNRRGLNNYIYEYISHRTDLPLTILMLDINGFKQVNDRYGHVMGDMALRDTAEALRRACRERENRLFLCRYGGDEFLIAGINRTADELRSLCEQIHEELSVGNEHRTAPYILKVSIGVATAACENMQQIEEQLRAADKAMYEEKQRQSAEE